MKSKLTILFIIQFFMLGLSGQQLDTFIKFDFMGKGFNINSWENDSILIDSVEDAVYRIVKSDNGELYEVQKMNLNENVCYKRNYVDKKNYTHDTIVTTNIYTGEIEGVIYIRTEAVLQEDSPRCP